VQTRRISVVNSTGEIIEHTLRLPFTILMQNVPWPWQTPRINPTVGSGWTESTCCAGWRFSSY
jgi:hypothetical protein